MPTIGPGKVEPARTRALFTTLMKFGLSPVAEFARIKKSVFIGVNPWLKYFLEFVLFRVHVLLLTVV